MTWKPQSHWDNHPDFPAKDWMREVSESCTRLSYIDWVNARLDESQYPAKCPQCGGHEQLEVTCSLLLPIKQKLGDFHFETEPPKYEHQESYDYHNHSYTTCNACGHSGDLKEFTKEQS